MPLHEMPFGAQVTDGGVRFRFWAPAQESVRLVLEGKGEPRPMRAAGDGWFELVADAAPGDRYRFELQDGARVADPASRAQAEDVHGPSLVVDPRPFAWRHGGWRGRPWTDTVLYELHVGTFTPGGTFKAAIERLPYLKELGVTAVELMPVADFPGGRGWGYDGVLHYAPAKAYGTPDELRELVDAAHGHGLMVFLDVVYNHFGPEGNYLTAYAPAFFTEDFHTPWGAAIDFRNRAVRDFYVHNALYWLEEFGFDGLRLDAVHAIKDPSETEILVELARAVRERFRGGRQVHLVVENEANRASLLRAEPDGGVRPYDGQWNDDWHHVAHVLLTGESGGYYEDFADRPAARFARALGEGYVYQGEPSRHQQGKPRGEPSGNLPPFAFVNFLQNHDQIGNRALGERLPVLAEPERVRAFQAILLLAPHAPMLFMGDEWGATTPFQYFCDFHGPLADAVREGRRREFAAFFADPTAAVPDPLEESTFAASRLDWGDVDREPHRGWLEATRRLLDLRRREIAPRLVGGRIRAAGVDLVATHGLFASWCLGDDSRLTLLANLGGEPWTPEMAPNGTLLHASVDGLPAEGCPTLPGWSAAWYLAKAGSGR